MDKMSRIISITNGRKTLGRGTPVLSNINLDLNRGESLSLIGKSGTGKSTLLSIIGLLDSFDSGEMMFMTVDVGERRQSAMDRLRGENVGFVFQKFSLIPHLSVLENVMVPLRHAGKLTYSGMKRSASKMLDSVGLSDISRRKPRELSGGQQQRVAIARALIRKPALILADEPTGSLDVKTGESIMNLLLGLVSVDGCGLIVVTHDTDIANRTEISLELSDGQLQPHTRGLNSNAKHLKLEF